MSYLLCITNSGYRASLESRKLYEQITDSNAEAHGLVRVRDESGEDYLFPADHFVAFDLPAAIQRELEHNTA